MTFRPTVIAVVPCIIRYSVAPCLLPLDPSEHPFTSTVVTIKNAVRNGQNGHESSKRERAGEGCCPI